MTEYTPAGHVGGSIACVGAVLFLVATVAALFSGQWLVAMAGAAVILVAGSCALKSGTIKS